MRPADLSAPASPITRRRFLGAASLGATALLPGCGSDSSRASGDVEVSDMRFGIIALTDCSPIVIAHEKGFFKKYGINSTVTKGANWAAIRDSLVERRHPGHAHAHRHADRLDDGPARRRRRSRWSSPGCSTATARASR